MPDRSRYNFRLPNTVACVLGKRSPVQGSLFRVTFLSLALLVGQHVFDDTTNGTAGTSGMINVPKLN